jgi:hypothetical protein
MYLLIEFFCRASILLVIGIALSGCASPPRAPTQEQVSQLKSIDLVVSVPPSNFSYRLSAGTVYAQPSVGMSVGTGIGINIAANLVFAGIDYALTATAREAQVPVGKSVEAIDLRKAAMAQLQGLIAGAPGAPLMQLSPDSFPEHKVRPRSTLTQMFIDQAKASKADATLFLMLAPSFRDTEGQTVFTGLAWLVRRSGETLLETSTEFVGPAHPEIERAEVVQWWADGRYRRFLGQGLRAVLIPVADALLMPALNESDRLAREVRLKSAYGSQPNAVRMTSTACAVDSDDARVVYRFERGRQRSRVIAYCPGETPKLWEPALVPNGSWVTEIQPPLTASK